MVETSDFPLSSIPYSIHCVHKYCYSGVDKEKRRESVSGNVGNLVKHLLNNYLSVFLSGVSVTVTQASALRGNTGTWSVPANTIQWEMTARDAIPFTRIDPGPGPLGTPPMSV